MKEMHRDMLSNNFVINLFKIISTYFSFILSHKIVPASISQENCIFTYRPDIWTLKPIILILNLWNFMKRIKSSIVQGDNLWYKYLFWKCLRRTRTLFYDDAFLPTWERQWIIGKRGHFWSSAEGAKIHCSHYSHSLCRWC
jgi:hypothetical protein